MKNLSLPFAILFFCYGFSATAQEKWQEWQSTTCYEKIQFRLRFLREYGDKTVSEIQFKSKYDSLVTFNYGITWDQNDFLAEYRKTLLPCETGKPQVFFTPNDAFYVLVDRLSFSTTGENPMPCDEEK